MSCGNGRGRKGFARMPDLHFQVSGAEAVPDALTPLIELKLNIRNNTRGERIQSILLRCQTQIETPRRSYSAADQTRLRDLFGEPERWDQTLRPIPWINAAAVVPAFTEETSIRLQIPCTIDLSVAASKYFFGVEAGTVPLTLMFSGTVFCQLPEGRLQAFPVPWAAEARFAFPVALWKDCIDLHYPNAAWLRLRRDVFERLYAFKVRESLATFEEAIELMLKSSLAASA